MVWNNTKALMMGWLRTNIGSIIALIWNLAAVVIFFKLIKDGDKTIKDTVQNIIILILGYYFGSTRTLNEKIKSEYTDKSDKSINNN